MALQMNDGTIRAWTDRPAPALLLAFLTVALCTEAMALPAPVRLSAHVLASDVPRSATSLFQASAGRLLTSGLR